MMRVLSMLAACGPYVKEKKDGRIGVQLTDKVGKDGDPGDPIDQLGTAGMVCVAPENIRPM
jgi:hypothetical protein